LTEVFSYYNLCYRLTGANFLYNIINIQESDIIEVIGAHADVVVGSEDRGKESDEYACEENDTGDNSYILPGKHHEVETEAITHIGNGCCKECESKESCEESHEDIATHDRSLDDMRSGTYKFHCVDKEALGIDMQANGIDNERHSDEEQEQCSPKEGDGEDADIAVEHADNILLIDNTADRRKDGECLLDGCNTVGLSIVGSKKDLIGSLKRIETKEADRVFAEILDMLTQCLVFGNELMFTGEWCDSEQVVDALEFVRLGIVVDDKSECNILFDLTYEVVGRDKDNTLNAYKEENQSHRDGGCKIHIEETMLSHAELVESREF